ncbi:2TM domain-containing protein [Luteirhabdus pelagi]|uniref:2TM domain-containing protein n=1 Tax=Luteirhabdus pelagi TaxID=2792783 RepID=UPI00193A0D1F|nr:2TM domain-containing protein [Luteirhabdus pelagi]
MNYSSPQNKYEYAKQRVEKLKGFYWHLSIYLLFIPVFLWLNYVSNTSFPWALFPIIGWGIGLIGHAADTYEWNPFFGKDWEKRKIEEFMREDS